MAPATSSAAVRDCGNYDGLQWSDDQPDGAGVFNVYGKNVSCTTARRLSLNAFRDYRPGDRKWRHGRWTCRIVSQSYEYTKARCARSGDRVVRWETGA